MKRCSDRIIAFGQSIFVRKISFDLQNIDGINNRQSMSFVLK